MSTTTNTIPPRTPASMAGDIRVISCEHLGEHRYRITTESSAYGIVVQEVFIFPDFLFDPKQTENAAAPR